MNRERTGRDTRSFEIFWAAALIALSILVVGCGTNGQHGPTIPSGATDIGGPPMTSAPPPPPGWNPKDVVPQNQQQAQDTLRDYLMRTLRELPDGTTLDATRYGSAGHNSWCEDEPADPKNVPTRYHTSGDLKSVPGTDPAEMILRVGEIWRGWGWYVVERDGFRKPNQFGYGPDGYRLQIVIAARDGFPPTLAGSSPCFPGELARDDIHFPVVLTAH